MNRRVVVSLITEEQEFQRLQAEEARVTAARLGLEAEVLYAENNAVLQIQQLFRFVHLAQDQRPAAIVTETVTGEGLERVARNAVGVGIGWVVLNRQVGYLEPLRREHPDIAIAMVSTDQEEVGRIQARQIRALLPGGGCVLYVQGPPDTSVAQDRLRGTQEGVGRVDVSFKVLSGDWTESSGERVVASWLRLKTSEGFQPALVAGQNDAMAVGARRGVQALRPEWAGVHFLGCDGLPEGGRRLVDRGVLAATVVTPSNTGPALERVARWLQSGELPPRDVLLEPHSYPSEDAIRP